MFLKKIFFLSQLFDGWELNGKVFPGLEDHQLSLEQRSSPLCSGRHRGASLLSSQNAALVSFKIPSPGQGFKLRVSFHPNPRRNYFYFP